MISDENLYSASKKRKFQEQETDNIVSLNSSYESDLNTSLDLSVSFLLNSSNLSIDDETTKDATSVIRMLRSSLNEMKMYAKVSADKCSKLQDELNNYQEQEKDLESKRVDENIIELKNQRIIKLLTIIKQRESQHISECAKLFNGMKQTEMQVVNFIKSTNSKLSSLRNNQDKNQMSISTIQSNKSEQNRYITHLQQEVDEITHKYEGVIQENNTLRKNNITLTNELDLLRSAPHIQNNSRSPLKGIINNNNDLYNLNEDDECLQFRIDRQQKEIIELKKKIANQQNAIQDEIHLSNRAMVLEVKNAEQKSEMEKLEKIKEGQQNELDAKNQILYELVSIIHTIDEYHLVDGVKELQIMLTETQETLKLLMDKRNDMKDDEVSVTPYNSEPTLILDKLSSTVESQKIEIKKLNELLKGYEDKCLCKCSMCLQCSENLKSSDNPPYLEIHYENEVCGGKVLHMTQNPLSVSFMALTKGKNEMIQQLQTELQTLDEEHEVKLAQALEQTANECSSCKEKDKLVVRMKDGLRERVSGMRKMISDIIGGIVRFYDGFCIIDFENAKFTIQKKKITVEGPSKEDILSSKMWRLYEQGKMDIFTLLNTLVNDGIVMKIKKIE